MRVQIEPLVKKVPKVRAKQVRHDSAERAQKAAKLNVVSFGNLATPKGDFYMGCATAHIDIPQATLHSAIDEVVNNLKVSHVLGRDFIIKAGEFTENCVVTEKQYAKPHDRLADSC